MVVKLYNRYYTIDGGKGFAKTVGFSHETYKWMKELEGQRVFHIKPVLSTRSCGSIKLKSNNFFDDLEIEGNYFHDCRDKENMVTGIMKLLKFVNCKAFKDFGVHLWEKPYPKCKHKKNKEYLNCVVDYLTISDEATMGSCRMGSQNDSRAVVDENLKVIGIEGLRVGGSSVIPGPFLGNIHLAGTMINERLADMLKFQSGYVVIKFCPVAKNEDSSEEIKGKGYHSDEKAFLFN